MLPTVFDRPLSYEPDRFAPPREEDKRKPFSFIGFGGGRHACIGQNFAYLQVGGVLWFGGGASFLADFYRFVGPHQALLIC